MRSIAVCFGVFAVFFSMLAGRAGLAADFRVESTVFSGKQKEPVSQSTTLFHKGVVYDYLADSRGVAILDQSHGRFILLDPAKKQKAEITVAEVATFAINLQSWAAKSSNGFLKFAADPKFEPLPAGKSSELLFVSSAITYHVKTTPEKQSDAAAQYVEFSDWFAKLNVMQKPGAIPPFARIAVNAELAARKVLPESVELTVPKQLALGGRGLNLRSEHVITWRLLQKDLDQIDATGGDISSFKAVSFRDFNK